MKSQSRVGLINHWSIESRTKESNLESCKQFGWLENFIRELELRSKLNGVGNFYRRSGSR